MVISTFNYVYLRFEGPLQRMLNAWDGYRVYSNKSTVETPSESHFLLFLPH